MKRVESVDLLRGLTIVLMVVVNAAYALHEKGVDVFSTLLHARWTGCTLADLVFPTFVFLVGVSIALAMGDVRDRTSGGPLKGLGARILRRSVALFLLGLALSFASWDAVTPYRVMGVLQRLALVYALASILYLTVRGRALVVLAAVILLAYSALLLVPLPDGTPADLHVRGKDIASHTDRLILGKNVYVWNTEYPFEPEGFLSTLPALAQALIGVRVGERLRAGPAARPLLGAGLAFTVAGWGASLLQPMVKALWNSSYVLFTTGIALLALGATQRLLDRSPRRGPVHRFLEAFGSNAITAYVWHGLMLPVFLVHPTALWLIRKLGAAVPEQVAALVPIAIFVLLTWMPVGVLYRRGVVVKV